MLDPRDFAAHLGLPGLIDVHTHFLPPPVQAKVWAQFDAAGPKLGREWPIRYRGSVEERVAQLRELGVRRFSTLPYAHRPGIAGYLNDWAAQFKREVPESLWSATLYPEPDVATYVAAGIEAGVEIWKVHVQVGEFHLDDPLLDPVWGALADVVPLPRPEGAAESVALGARHHVQVQVRHGLADGVVHGDEGPLRAELVDDGRGDPLRGGEERVAQPRRQVGQGHDVLARDEQHVPLEDRALVEERDQVVGLEHEVGGQVAGRDRAEHAPVHG